MQRELARRGYGFHGNRNAGIHLTVPHKTKKFKHTGSAERMLLIPVKQSDYQSILNHAKSAQEAADQIEAMSTGKTLAPTVGGQPNASGFDATQIEKLIENRLANAVEAATRPIAQKMADQENTIEQQQATISKLTEALEKQGKKTARKATGRKRRNVVKESQSAVDLENMSEDERKDNANSDEPQLTPEQEAMLRQLNTEGQGHA